MTKKNYAHIALVLDRSGSMGIIKNDVIGGYNTFIKEQQEDPGEATFTLVQFDDHYEMLQDFVNLKDARILNNENYIPRGSTKLLDAVGNTIVTVGEKLASMSESERPSVVIFVVYTDGEENSSLEFTKDQIAKMVKEQEETYNWKFIYLSSDLNAFADASSYGFNPNNTLNMGKSGKANRAVYSVTSCLVSQYRSGNLNASFTDSDREATK